ncbi:hypothetical protein LX36DRAFT_661372 [Colletotrichum falcatum]|nr:hypothetical protein LX36DRAFT_661372 [Colletotrichum falcatum]
MQSIAATTPEKPSLINLQLGWPSPRLFAAGGLLDGATQVLTSESETAAALIYGPHVGYPPLRKSVAEWLSSVYGGRVDHECISISNGASGNLANILLKFTDPLYTRRIFMVEPTYFLACPIFQDNGFRGKLRGVSDDVYDFLSWPDGPQAQDCTVATVPPRLVDVDRAIPGYST